MQALVTPQQQAANQQSGRNGAEDDERSGEHDEFPCGPQCRAPSPDVWLATNLRRPFTPGTPANEVGTIRRHACVLKQVKTLA